MNCPNCKYGLFMGCPNFPHCKGSAPIKERRKPIGFNPPNEYPDHVYEEEEYLRQAYQGW